MFYTFEFKNWGSQKVVSHTHCSLGLDVENEQLQKTIDEFAAYGYELVRVIDEQTGDELDDVHVMFGGLFLHVLT